MLLTDLLQNDPELKDGTSPNGCHFSLCPGNSLLNSIKALPLEVLFVYHM